MDRLSGSRIQIFWPPHHVGTGPENLLMVRFISGLRSFGAGREIPVQHTQPGKENTPNMFIGSVVTSQNDVFFLLLFDFFGTYSRWSRGRAITGGWDFTLSTTTDASAGPITLCSTTCPGLPTGPAPSVATADVCTWLLAKVRRTALSRACVVVYGEARRGGTRTTHDFTWVGHVSRRF